MEKMQASLLNLNEAVNYKDGPGFKTTLSFRSFIEYLRKNAEEADSAKAAICRAALNRFLEYPELSNGIAVEETARYLPLLEQIYVLLTPALPQADVNPWALSVAASPYFFYGTASFYEQGFKIGAGTADSMQVYTPEQWKEKRLHNIYSVILEKLYGISLARKEIIYERIDDQTGLSTYYRLHFDTRFITVTCDINLPELSIEVLQDQLSQQLSPLHLLESILPLKHFSFEGFSVITLTDITTSHMLNRLRDLRMPQEACSDKSFSRHVEQTLKTIAGSNKVHIGLLPFLRINNKVVFDHDISYQSLLMQMGKKHQLEEEALFLHFAENYMQHPRVLFFRSASSPNTANNLLAQLLVKEGVGSYVAIPLNARGQLVGVLEIYADEADTIDEKMLSKLNVAEALLAQLMQYTIDAVKEEIGHVINEKFTPLQPAVAWKFNEAAWQHIRQMDDNGKDVPLPPVVFDNVYPLYGAIDVRNSTIERNNALKADLLMHFSLLHSTLHSLEQYSGHPAFAKIKKKCDEWTNIIDVRISPYQTFKVEDYLLREVVPFLQEILQQHPETAAIVTNYMQSIDQKNGVAYLQRRNFEISLQAINASVGENLNQFNRHLQESFPCYFDKFRTDGVEYDVYAGSSITPGKTLTKEILKDMRKKQLAVMAHIARQAKELLPGMPMPLQTTQLIFVHSTPIDIAFRADERRFDVEGSYNIRYQVVKKRIDKAFIKNTTQRLTQPGTIAIVYFEKTEISDYLEGAKALQETLVLSPEIEWLELEDLQGVSGLKAVRLYLND